MRIFWLPQVSLCADKSDVFMRSLLILGSEPFTRMLPESGWSYYCWGTGERLELAEANLPPEDCLRSWALTSCRSKSDLRLAIMDRSLHWVLYGCSIVMASSSLPDIFPL